MINLVLTGFLAFFALLGFCFGVFLSLVFVLWE